MQARFNAYSTPAMQEFAGRPFRAEASAAERQAWQKAFDRVAEMDDEEDFPPAEYGPVALRFSYWNSGGIFPAWSPNSLSHQPPRYEHRVLCVVDPLAFQRHRQWLAVLVGVVKNDDISIGDFTQKREPRHLDNILPQPTDALVAAIITHPKNQLAFIRCDNHQFVQPFGPQHSQKDRTTFYYKWGWRAHLKKYDVRNEAYTRRFIQVQINGEWESALWVEG